VPGFVRLPLARFIARRRAPVAREIYAKIGGRSPILEETQAQADALAQRATTSNWSEGSARNLLTALASVDGEFSAKAAPTPVLAQRAKRLVLALDRLAYALDKNRSVKLKAEAEMKVLFEDVKVLDSFDPAAFAAHLKALRAVLDKAA